MWLKTTLRRALTWPTLLGLLPIVIALIGSGIITYRYNLLLTETRNLVAHSLETTTAIDDLMISLEDIETGQRGYLITGDAAYLEPYRIATKRLTDNFARLRALVGDDADQRESLRRVDALVTAKLVELNTTIDVRRSEGFEAARAIVASNTGKDIMDEIRGEIAVMRDREATLLHANSDAMRKTERRVVLVVAASIVLAILGRVLSILVPIAWRRSRVRMRKGAASSN
jgi:methyl-accepting chemotaxis protein